MTARDRIARSALTRPLWNSRVANIARRARFLNRRLGSVGGLRFEIQRQRLARASDDAPIALTAPGLPFSLACRPHTSDFAVFEQVFLNDDYRPALSVSPLELVVDCGAYVGYSAAYFLSANPAVRVLAVEPDAENFALLAQNLAPYGSRAMLCHAALWSHQTELSIDRTGYRDGRHWARQVQPCGASDGPRVTGLDMTTLLDQHHIDRVSVLKVDIEGAEATVFAGGADAWLPRINAIIIELHDDSPFGPATEIVHRACRNRFTIRDCGHVTLATAISPA
jgi:FkbM family methyltransferase